MTAYLLNWLVVLLGWIHLIAGIAWIGSSFYLVRLENQPPPPRTLRWLCGQAYSTWLSGLALLCLLYFMHAAARMVPLAVAILLGSWLVYEGLCRSKFGQSPVRLAIALALSGSVLAWGVGALFAGPGAFILFGAVLGTIMAGNVAQRSRAGQRWAHNTYFTLPVLFVMLSAHSPLIYSGPHSWMVLLALSFCGICIRGWFVSRHRPGEREGFGSLLLLALGLLALLIIIIGLYPDAAATV